MTFVDRFAAGYHVGRASLRLLRRRPSLLVYSALSAGSVVVVTYVGLALAQLYLGDWRGPLWSVIDPLRYPDRLPVVFAAAVTYSAAVTFWNAALVGTVARMLDGEPAPLTAGIRDAWDARRRILLWALASGAVGVFLRVVDRRDGGFSVGRVLLGAAWTFLTYFVVPVMVVERTGGLAMLRRSKELVRALWAESTVAYVGVATAFGLLAYVAALVGIVLPEVLDGFVVPARPAVAYPAWGALFSIIVVGFAATSVAKVLLFDVATSGEDPTDPDAYRRYASE